MNKIKQYFERLKKSGTPWVRWVLLGLAISLLLIFAIVILPGNNAGAPKISAPKTSKITATPERLQFAPEAEVEEKQTALISATTETLIFDVRLETHDGSLKMTNTCVGLQRISEQIPCQVNLAWNPVGATKDSNKILIEYGAVGTPKDAALRLEIPVSMIAPKPILVEPVVEPLPTAAAPIEPLPIAAADDEIFDDFLAATVEPLPVAMPPEPVVKPEPIPESCYRFAFIGYDLDGLEAGWIRPSGGRYMFHPWTDDDCTSPIGEYNIETGYIYDIKDKARRIGSDIEHIQSSEVGGKYALPKLGSSETARVKNKARQLTMDEIVALPSVAGAAGAPASGGFKKIFTKENDKSIYEVSSMTAGDAIISTLPFDRKFVLRQFKPIPATIVNDVRADERVNELPVRAVVERNVYSDSDRTVIIPAGTMLLGYVTGTLPGPYKTLGRIQINWYQMIRPDNSEFHVAADGDLYSADSQGRIGVPGRGNTDYIEELVLPMVAGLLPAAVNMIAPITDKFVNQIDLNNNTVVQSGELRSSERAKQEIIKSWDKVSQRLVMDMLDNTTQPFTIPAGTRITVLSRKDIVINWDGRSPSTAYASRRSFQDAMDKAIQSAINYDPNSEEWVGQVRSTDYDESTGQIRYNTKNAFLQSLMNQANQYDSKYQNQQMAVTAAANAAAKNAVDACGNNANFGYVYEPGTCNIADLSKGAPKTPAAKSIEDQIFQGNAPLVDTMPGVATGTPLCDDGSPIDANGCCPSAGEHFVNDQGGICCLADEITCFPPLL